MASAVESPGPQPEPNTPKSRPPFTNGSFLLLVDRLLEQVEESKMQRIVNENLSKDLEVIRAAQSESVPADVTPSRSREEYEKLIANYSDLEKKFYQVVSEKEQAELKNSLLKEEGKALREDIFRCGKEKVAAVSRAAEAEAKLSVHTKGKEAVLGQMEQVQERYRELVQSHTLLSSSLEKLRSNLEGAQTLQRRLEALNKHSSCINSGLQGEIKEKTREIVQLRTAIVKLESRGMEAHDSPKHTGSLPEDKKFIALLEQQLKEHACTIDSLQKLVQTSKTSTNELAAAYLAEKKDIFKKSTKFVDDTLRLQTQLDLLKLALHEKDQEHRSVEEDFELSELRAQELTEELAVLKEIVLSQKSTSNAAVGTERVGVVEVGCQKEEESKPGTDNIDVTLDSKSCQTEEVFQSLNSTKRDRSPPSSPSTQPAPVKRVKSDQEPSETFTDQEPSETFTDHEPCETFTYDDISPSPLPLSKRLSMRSCTSSIPIRLNESLEQAVNSPENATCNDEKQEGSQPCMVPEDEFYENLSLEIATTPESPPDLDNISTPIATTAESPPEVEIISTPDSPQDLQIITTPCHGLLTKPDNDVIQPELLHVREGVNTRTEGDSPKTPEHLIDSEENRKKRKLAYFNDPAYSPLDADSPEIATTSAPYKPTACSEENPRVAESPEFMVPRDPSSVSHGPPSDRCVETVEADTTSEESEEGEQWITVGDTKPGQISTSVRTGKGENRRSENWRTAGDGKGYVRRSTEIRPIVTRIVNSAFRDVDAMTSRSSKGKLDLYKASLSKSPGRNKSTISTSPPVPDVEIVSTPRMSQFISIPSNSRSSIKPTRISSHPYKAPQSVQRPPTSATYNSTEEEKEKNRREVEFRERTTSQVLAKARTVLMKVEREG